MAERPLKARELIALLASHGVEFVVVGGIAAVSHGHIYTTLDLDICAPLVRENVERLMRALAGVRPTQRLNPNRPPFPPDLAESVGLRNLYIETDLGRLDVLGELSGVGTFADAARCSIEAEVHGQRCRVITLEALIAAKRAAGREKDRMALPALEALRKMQDDPKLYE